MDRGQETTELPKGSEISFASSSSTSNVAPKVSQTTSQKLMLARERNDKNRDHLSTAYNVYKQLYGESAAKEAFIEIAANISADEDDSSEQLDISVRPSIDESVSSTKAGVDGPTKPRYLSYRQSLSSQKDRPPTNHQKSPPVTTYSHLHQHTGTKNSSPASITSYQGSELIQDDEHDSNDLNVFSLAIPAPTDLAAPMSFKNQPLVGHVDQYALLSATFSSEVAASDVTDYTPLATSSEPPRYIKYRASLGDRSVSSSIQSESSRIIRKGSVEASEADSTSAANSSADAIAPAWNVPSKDSESLASSAISTTPVREKTESNLPRYVKYRTSLSKRSRGEMSPISESHVSAVLDSMSHSDAIQPTAVRTSTAVTAGEEGIRDRDNQILKTTSTAAVAVAATVETAKQTHPNPVPDNQGDGTSVVSSASSVSSSQRYLAYRSSLKEKPWSASLKDSSLLLTTPSKDAPTELVPSESNFESTMNQSADGEINKNLPPKTHDERGIPSSPGNDKSGESSMVDDSSAGASVADILTDLYSAEQSATILCEDKTLISELTEGSSSRASASVAERVLLSASSASDDEAMTSSVADHSAATPIISNSAQNKLKHFAKTSKPNRVYLASYDSASSFDSDPDADVNLMYTANVQKSPTSKTKNSVNNSNGIDVSAAIVSPPPSFQSDDNPDSSGDISTTPSSVSNLLNIGSIPQNASEQDKSTSLVSEDNNSPGKGVVLIGASSISPTTDASQSPLSKNDVSDDANSTSSDNSSGSSSSLSSSSSSSKSVPRLAQAALLKDSYDSEAVENSGGVGSKAYNYSDTFKKDSNKVPALVTGTNINVDKKDMNIVYTSSDDEDIGNQADVDQEADPESGLLSNLSPKETDDDDRPEEIKRRESDINRRKYWRNILLLVVVLLVSAGIGGGVAYAVRKDKNRNDNQQPSSSPLPAPAASAAPSLTYPSSPVPSSTRKPTSPRIPTLGPTPSALFSLLATASSDDGTSMSTPGTPQNDAFIWLSNDPDLNDYSDTRKIQRYALTTFYYSTFGKNWTDSSGWGTYTDECSWYSRSSTISSCDSGGNFKNLDLGYNEVSGELPPEIGMLTEISRFVISGGIRRTMIGTLPTELGLLTRMELFLVQGNSIYGIIPTELGSWNSVVTLDLSMNNLFGTIPSAIGQWQSLRFLDMSNNRFVGKIPSSIRDLTSLERLSMGENALTGPMPTVIDSLISLKVINLEKNRLTGISAQIANMESLETLSMYDNYLEGTLLSQIGNLISLRQLKLSNNRFSGALPSEIGKMTTLQYLDLSYNNFTSSIPPEIGRLTALLALQLENNKLTSTIPVEFSDLASASLIRVDSNNLTGTVPDAVCQTFEVEFPAFYVDCGSPGQPGEVSCPEGCCTFCCIDGVGCKCMFEGTPYQFLCYR